MNAADVKILGREPAAILAFSAIVVKLVAAFWVVVTPDQQTWINAVIAAIVGLVVAVIVHDGLIAAITGGAQAVLALSVGFGLDWSTDKQAIVMSAVALASAFFIRTQVTAPDPIGSQPGKLL